MTKSFKNDNMIVSFWDTDRPYIIIKDLTDLNNEPTAFTRNIRGINKAWQFISQIFNKEELKHDLKLNDITKILDEKFKLRTHYYCAMD